MTWSNYSFTKAFESGNLGRKTRYGTMHVHHFDTCSFLCLGKADNSGGGRDEIIAMKFPGGYTIWNKEPAHALLKKKEGWKNMVDRVSVNFQTFENEGGDITKSKIIYRQGDSYIIDICQKRYIPVHEIPEGEICREEHYMRRISSLPKERGKINFLQVDKKCATISEAVTTLIPNNAEFYVDGGWWVPKPGYNPPRPTEEEINIVSWIPTPFAYGLNIDYIRLRDWDLYNLSSLDEKQFLENPNLLEKVKKYNEDIVKWTNTQNKLKMHYGSSRRYETSRFKASINGTNLPQRYEDEFVAFYKGIWKTGNGGVLPFKPGVWYKLET
jgi:hypothetical protein